MFGAFFLFEASLELGACFLELPPPRLWSLPARALCRGRFRLGVLAPHWLLNQPIADRLGADLHAYDPAINDGADLLDVGTELAGGDPGNLGPDPAKVLGFAAMGDLIPKAGLLTGKMTNARHAGLSVQTPSK